MGEGKEGMLSHELLWERNLKQCGVAPDVKVIGLADLTFIEAVLFHRNLV
jgi:hypothetical protein